MGVIRLCVVCVCVFFFKSKEYVCIVYELKIFLYILALCCWRRREYAGTLKRKFKPVVISHHMLSGLKEGQEKMSKSDPESAIFMEGKWCGVAFTPKYFICLLLYQSSLQLRIVLRVVKSNIFYFFGSNFVVDAAGGWL
jgi:hypothetical protein